MAATLCAVCDSSLMCKWTDTHGIGACGTCGCPYRLYHYENDQPVDKAPTLAVKEAWIPLAREYWQAEHRRVFPAAFDIAFLSGHERSYSGATPEDCKAFKAFLESRKDAWPKRDDAVESEAR